MNTNLDNIEQNIVDELDLLCKMALKDNFSTPKWTTEIKSIIGDIGHKQGHLVCASNLDGIFSDEWLFDLTWYKNDSKGRLIDVPLIMECEWKGGLKHIKDDFEKLLIAKSKYKILIFQGSYDNILNYRKDFISQIKKFERKAENERYLFIGYDKHEGRFEKLLYLT